MMIPLSGSEFSDFETVRICCFLSCSSLLCWKSVEADKGSPSLSRATNTNTISDMLVHTHLLQDSS